MSDTHWYRRLGDIPGVHYQGLPEKDRRLIKGYGSTPTVTRFGGRSWLEWPGGRSTSPAYDYQQNAGQSPTVAGAMGFLARLLELPGTASDYHFPIQDAIDTLWSQRGEHPEALPKVEELCLLNIDLLEAQKRDHPDEALQVPGGWVGFSCFPMLINLYVADGNLEDAAAIARRASAFGQMQVELAELNERIAAVEAEDVK